MRDPTSAEPDDDRSGGDRLSDGGSTLEPPRESLRPIEGADRQTRRHLNLKDELVLAVLPTVTILLVLALVEVLSRQRFLFASLASSAFLIYLDPQHGTNTIRTLVSSHLGAAVAGVLAEWAMGPGYGAAGAAMVATIILMITLDIVHPPAISTSLSFAFRSASEQSLVLFVLAVAVIAILVLLQRATLMLLARMTRETTRPE